MNRFVYMEDHLVLPHVLYLNNMFDPKIEVHDLYLTNQSVFRIEDDIYLSIYSYPVLTTTLLNSGII